MESAAERLLVIVAAVCLIQSSGCTKPVLIRAIEAATSTDEIGPGGWDSTVSKRFFAPRLSDCGLRVLRSATDWANASGLPVIKRDVGPRRVQIHVGDVDLRGFYEILYRLDDNGRRASIHFEYYDKHGTVSALAVLRERTSTLIAELESAITCTGE